MEQSFMTGLVILVLTQDVVVTCVIITDGKYLLILGFGFGMDTYILLFL